MMSTNIRMVWELTRFGLFVCVPIGVTFIDYVGLVRRVDGVSMQPTLNPENSRPSRDYVFANRFAALNHNFKRGEIVTFTCPKDPKLTNVKRIIGLPGDYVRLKSDEELQHFIPDGHCWVEGDNRQRSSDSNSYGPVPMGLILEKVTYIVWPPSRFGKLEIKEPSKWKVSKIRDSKFIDIQHWYKERKESKL